MRHIAFLDWVRIVACMMVILVHACEFYYIGEDGLRIASDYDAFWVTWIDSMVRCAVPLFVMVSGFLLLPVKDTTPIFFRKRMVRVVIPFIFWSLMYAVLPSLWSDTDPIQAFNRLPFNFNEGHLWFVYMIIGIYLFMPVISPWLERCSKREEQLFLILWAISMFFPYLRWFNGYIYGEGAWNEFNTLWYFSGFMGYAVLGHYLRHHCNLQNVRNIAPAIAMIIVGYAVTALIFRNMLTITTDLGEVELSWRFCTPNVALVALGFFLLLAHVKHESATTRQVANLTYGIYLMHIFLLNFAYRIFAPICSTPMAIALITLSTFLTCVIISKAISLIPGGKYIIG